ncbi:hypothetical protein MBLNU459_g1961t1 [Dothideomycetes sp. NU459]
MSADKAQVLVFGSGGVGTIAALNLEAGGLASVTAVLRSNYETVQEKGFSIQSCDHGTLTGWKPTSILNHVPRASSSSDDDDDAATRFDYIVCTTKNIPDCPPTLTELIAPAVTPGHTVIVLIQNGLNIEQPLHAAFPANTVLSGISLIGSHEVAHGVIEHDDHDRLLIGPFAHPGVAASAQAAAAEDFVRRYGAAGRTSCEAVAAADVPLTRWRKLVYNACLNSACALTGLDTGRVRLAGGLVGAVVRPAMEEIRAAARAAAGVELPADVVDTMIGIDPLTMYLPPSMLGDVRKGNFTEVENVVGEPLRAGTRAGVQMPTLGVLYNLLKAIQWRTMEERGRVTVPPKGSFVAE